MPEQDIATIVEEEITDWEDMSLTINPSFAPTEREILELIDFYWMSKFQGGDDYGTKWQKLFFNIIENPTAVASKQIDFDTKDIKIMAEPGHDHYRAYLLERELNLWMKEQEFGKLINESIYNLPKYGHLYMKKSGGDLSMVHPTLMRVNPTVKSIVENPHMEQHRYTSEELEFWGKKLNWGNVNKVLGHDPDEDGKYTVYERYSPVTRRYSIVFLNEKKQKEVLVDDKMDDMYREHKWEDIPGRHLGRGTVEKLFSNQIARNESENFFRQGLKWTALKIFQTRDKSIAANFLYEIENGDVLRTSQDISQVTMDERNLSSYQYADNKWGQNAQERTFAFNPLQGARDPAGTRLGQTVIQTKMAGTYYELRQEDLGMFFSKLIEKDVLPEFKKKRSARHLFDLLNLGDDEEGEKFRRNMVTAKTNKAVIAKFVQRGKFGSLEDMRVMKLAQEQLLKSGNRDLAIPQNYYANLKYKIKVVITGEQIDMAGRQTLAMTLLQIIGSNPVILQDKNSRKAIEKIIEWGGINPEEFNLGPVEPSAMNTLLNQRGGSSPRQTTPSTPAVTQQTTSV